MAGCTIDGSWTDYITIQEMIILECYWTYQPKVAFLGSFFSEMLTHSFLNKSNETCKKENEYLAITESTSIICILLTIIV